MSEQRKRPELGVLEPGQHVMVRRSPNDARGRKQEDMYIPAVVVKAARVWVDLEALEEGWPRVWRMRRDTQDEGSQYPGSVARFLTVDQYAWEKTWNWALDVLREHGINLCDSSPWRDRKIELAKMLTNASATEEGE